MLSIYNLKRKTVLVATMIFTSLAVAMMAQSTYAQDMAAVRRAVVSNGSGSKIFRIDTSGRMTVDGDAILEITSLNDSGALVGKYYSSGRSAPPTSTNVTGSINIVRAAGGTPGSAIRISFTVTQSAGIGFNETVFEGAIRLGGARNPTFGFMAGTFNATVTGGVGGAQGPFPFCAKLSSVAPG